MGCDIHAAVEIKIAPWDDVPEASWWVMAGEVHIDRHYAMFAALAGVRNYDAVEPVVAPRGLPKDVSRVMEAWHSSWAEDAHSTSWVTARELMAYEGFDFLALVNEIDKRERTYNAINSRLVFFFDN